MKSPKVGQVNKDGSADLDGDYDLNSASTKLRLAVLYSVNPQDIVNSPDIMDKRGIVSLQFVETLPFGHIDDPAGTRIAEGNKDTGYYSQQKAKELFASLPESYKKAGSLKCTALSGSVLREGGLGREGPGQESPRRRPYRDRAGGPSPNSPHGAATPIPRFGTSL